MFLQIENNGNGFTISIGDFTQRDNGIECEDGGPYYYGYYERSAIDKLFNKEDANIIKSSEKGSIFIVRTGLLNLCNDLDNISPEFNLYSSYGEED